jgi:hypothetical protein
MGTVFLLDPYAEQGKTVKKAVDCPQRADKTAERPEDEHGRRHKKGQQGQFQEEKTANKLPKGGVKEDQGESRLQSPGGTEEFTKERFPETVDKEGPQGQNDDREGQKAVFQQGQPPGKGTFEEFGGRYPVQEFLDKAEGTEEAANPPAQGYAGQEEEAGNEKRKTALGKGILQGSQGAGGDRAGAGIAVKSGDADPLEGAAGYGALGKTPEIRVADQHGQELDAPP